MPAPKSKTYRQTVDILNQLQADDPRVRIESGILQNLKHTLYRHIASGRLAAAGKSAQPLYAKYGLEGFPLKQSNGSKIPAWRFLSPWMKVQLALLVLGEGNYRTFKIHVHDDVREKLERDGKDQKAYLRDRVRRQLRVFYDPGNLPHFFFVMEDRDKDGGFTRPHAHGAIAILPCPLVRVDDERHRRRLEKVQQKHGDAIAEREAGRWATRKAMRAAAGLEGYRPRQAGSGLNQARNVWWTKPVFGIFNPQWGTYMLKNAAAWSPVLSESRLAIPYGLLAQCKVLWAIIRGD